MLLQELSLWTEIEGENQGFASYVYSEEDRFASYDTSELTGWKIVATMGYAELGNDISIIRNCIRDKYVCNCCNFDYYRTSF